MADLKDLKPGDEVAIVAYMYDSVIKIVVIEHVTPEQIIADGRRWNRCTGRSIGHVSSVARYIEPATDVYRRIAERKKLWEIINRAFTPPRSCETRNNLSTEAMRIIAGALEADEARRGERG